MFSTLRKSKYSSSGGKKELRGEKGNRGNVNNERKKGIRRRQVGRDYVVLKSWHLLNRAVALGAKFCQPSPLAWISALPLSLFSAWHFASSPFLLLFLLYISVQNLPNSKKWHLQQLNERTNKELEDIYSFMIWGRFQGFSSFTRAAFVSIFFF